MEEQVAIAVLVIAQTGYVVRWNWKKFGIEVLLLAILCKCDVADCETNSALEKDMSWGSWNVSMLQ